ncbi:DNA cytosine methyltransferase [Catellatospora coxensis]
MHAVQWWKDTPLTRLRKIGKYGQQYLYICPNVACMNTVVEPYVSPAGSVIDWTDLGQRIGDRDPSDPLAPNTISRIRQGLKQFSGEQSLITVNHGDGGTGRAARALPLHGAPLPTRTVKIGEGVLTPPLLVPAGGSWNTTASPTTRPFRTRTGSESEALLTPEPFVAVLRNHGTAHSIRQPFQTMAAGGGHHALVVPYRRNNRTTSTDEPLHTMATRDSGALVRPAVAVEDCRFRMLKPREQLRAQTFPDTYRVTGNVAEQTMQAGNAVTCTVAQWLGNRVMTALDSRAAA